MSISRRWQERRERVAREEAGEPTEEARHAAIGADEANSDVALPERAVELAEHRMAAEAVDLDTLGPEADMSVFLREGVPAMLRRQAFRALWRSSPMFGDFERLNDYDEDFRNPKMVMQTFQSAWQAGRGYLEKVTEPKDGNTVANVEAVAAEQEAVPATDAEQGAEVDASRDARTDASGATARDDGAAPEAPVAAGEAGEGVPQMTEAPAKGVSAPSLRQRLGV